MIVRPRTKRWHLGMIGAAASAVLLTGCAGTADSQAPAATPEAPMAPAMVMPSGMSMSPGAAMPTAEAMASSSDPGSPSAAAQMVCGPGTRADVATMLGLASGPHSTATFVDHLYTCSYRLPWGLLVLSVKESASVPAAEAYFDALRNSQPKAAPLPGAASLGLPAFENPNGSVAFRKGDKILQVDASAMTSVVGPHHQNRNDVAYQIASDVLGCWNGE